MDKRKVFDALLHSEMTMWRQTTLNKLLLFFAIINAGVTALQFLVISYTRDIVKCCG